MANSSRRHHLALDEVVNLLGKANRDMAVVQHHLEKEFQLSYPKHANPSKITDRIKKMQEELVALKEMCRELLAEKQEFIDMGRATLVGQKSLLQRLHASCGLPLISDSDNLVYTNLDEVILEWKSHMGVKTGDGKRENSEDINNLLFSVRV